MVAIRTYLSDCGAHRLDDLLGKPLNRGQPDRAQHQVPCAGFDQLDEQVTGGGRPGVRGIATGRAEDHLDGAGNLLAS